MFSPTESVYILYKISGVKNKNESKNINNKMKSISLGDKNEFNFWNEKIRTPKAKKRNDVVPKFLLPSDS